MTHIAFNSKIDTIRTAFSQLWNEVISRSSKRLSGCLSKLQLFCTQTSVCPCALSRSKCLKEDRKKDNKLLKSPLAQYIGFYVLFYNASITIGFDEMIGKECSFVSFSIRLWEISTVSVPQKSRRKWARIARPDLERVFGVILSSSRSEKLFSESVSYSSAYVRTSATAT